MTKARVFAAALGLFALLYVVLPAQASSLTSAQISAIVSLLQSFGADQTTITGVESALGGTATPSSSCVNLTRNLTLGMTGSDDTNLQNYLIAQGYLPAGNNAGYYGYLTASAVGQLQLKLGIVSSQNDSAYGITGPKTRAAIGCGTTPPKHPTGAFTAHEQLGGAPFEAYFTYDTVGQPGGYQVQFGDGSLGHLIAPSGAGNCAGTAGECFLSVNHVYPSAGTYAATLTDGAGNMLGTATITVTGNDATLSVSPTSGSAPLSVTFSVSFQQAQNSGASAFNFGDGTLFDLRDYCGIDTCQAQHTYASPGTYSATLVDASGNSLATQIVTVSSGTSQQ